MALTIGSGPLGPSPGGRFNRDLPNGPLLYWEPFPKRFRVVLGGETLADSRGAMALHETGQLMRVALPPGDVRRDLLNEGGEGKGSPATGPARRWTARVGNREISDVARSFPAPPADAAWLADYLIFDLHKVDAWYQEDDLGYAHPRDPYHRCDVHRTSRRVVVRHGDTLIAETSAPAMLFETSIPPRFYLPPDAVRPGMLVKSETISQCPYKGDGQHWHVQAGGERIADACWSLTTPIGDALTIPRWFSFYTEKVTVEVDGERVGQALSGPD